MESAKLKLTAPQTTENYHSDPKGFLGILKGESGEGKSTAAFSFPNAYVFDFDKKMPAIYLKHFPNGRIHWDTFSLTDEIEDKITEFESLCPYETLIVDSITGMVNIIFDSVANVKGESVPKQIKKVTPKNTIEMAGIDYYSAEDRWGTWFIDKLKALWAKPGNPKHIIIICHVVQWESSPNLKTGEVIINRSIVAKGRKFPAWLPTGFDNVYVVGRESTDGASLSLTPKRLIMTEGTVHDSAKCSYPIDRKLDITDPNKKSFFWYLKPYITPGERASLLPEA